MQLIAYTSLTFVSRFARRKHTKSPVPSSCVTATAPLVYLSNARGAFVAFDRQGQVRIQCLIANVIWPGRKNAEYVIDDERLVLVLMCCWLHGGGPKRILLRAVKAW